MTAFVRTPEDRFSSLPDYPFPPSYLEHAGLRIHYVDVGEGRPVVLFHGEPTWSFLYRKVIPGIVAAGYRVIAPDYPGFGRSDKPTDPAFYTYDRHIAFMEALLGSLEITRATAVVQDWGGPIGLRLAAHHPEWFDRLVILNTGLFTGGAPSAGFMNWRSFVERTQDIPVGKVMSRSAVQDWPADVLSAYEAPFPDAGFKAGVKTFPLIVPLSPSDPGAAEMAAVRDELRQWTNPALVLFSTEDPIFPTHVGERMAELIPGAGPLETIDGAGHFLQEDRGEEVGARIAAFLVRSES